MKAKMNVNLNEENIVKIMAEGVLKAAASLKAA
jgi:hypothetical protein